jgi:hypothetical protein
LLKHSVNCHPRKIARPDKDLLDLIHNYDNGQSVDDNYDKDNELGNYDIELQKRGKNEQNEKQLFI